MHARIVVVCCTECTTPATSRTFARFTRAADARARCPSANRALALASDTLNASSPNASAATAPPAPPSSGRPRDESHATYESGDVRAGEESPGAHPSFRCLSMADRLNRSES